MDKISLGLSLLCSVGAAAALTLAIYFFIKDKQKQGSAFSVLMFVCVVLAYVPQLDSIKGGFVDAKFNRTINQANDVIDRLRKMAMINAKVAYAMLAWENRPGAPAERENGAIVREIEKQLVELDVSAADRREISSIYVTMLGLDLQTIFYAVLDNVVWQKLKHADELLAKQDSAENKAFQQQRWNDATAWRKEISEPVLIREFRLENGLMIPEKLLDPEEQRAARKFKDELLKMFNDMKLQGRPTEETSQLIDTYLGIERDKVSSRKARELFSASFEESAK